MSKSAENDLSRINLTDSIDVIANKIKRCKTDASEGLEFGNPDRPECTNLLSIYQLASGKSKEEVAEECRTMRWGAFKPLLADALVEHMRPIQTKYQDIMQDPTYIDNLLSRGAESANQTASLTLGNVKDAMGFVPPFK